MHYYFTNNIFKPHSQQLERITNNALAWECCLPSCGKILGLGCNKIGISSLFFGGPFPNSSVSKKRRFNREYFEPLLIKIE